MSPPSRTAPIEVLLVEDDVNDVELTMRALKGAKLRNRVHVARDGAEALDFLQQHRPDLILLDLNLPKVDGREVLEQVKADERLRHIPVIVVTSSRAEEDIARSYHVHANAYVTKPIDPAVFLKAVNAIGAFWLEIVRLP
jgi:two-component system, chemotaxis family, response regulator Rcp1